jgi:hypothetical protein
MSFFLELFQEFELLFGARIWIQIRIRIRVKIWIQIRIWIRKSNRGPHQSVADPQHWQEH